MKRKGIIITVIVILVVIAIVGLCYENLSKNYSVSIKSPKDVFEEIKDKFSPTDAKSNVASVKNDSLNKDQKNADTESDSKNNVETGNEKSSNQEANSLSPNSENSNIKGEEQVIKSTGITLKMSEAVIGTKVQIAIGDDVKAKYKGITFYEVFDGDKQVSPQAKIDAPTLIMANKNENDIVKVKLFDSKANVLAKLNAKLVK